jgi:hypothetical protein
MKSGVSMFFCLSGMLAFATAGIANVNDAPPPASDQPAAAAPAPEASTEQPYSAIWTRNVFNLTPPPPPPDTNKVENTPPPNVKLIGIYTILGKTAVLSVLDAPERGQQAKKEEWYSMKEGERRGVLEVLEINPTARTVRIKNEEIVSTITFETNKPAGGPAGMTGGPHPMQGFQPPHPMGGIPLNNGAPGPLPNRMPRSAPSAQNYQPNNGAAGYGSGYNYNNGYSGGVPNAFNSSQYPGNNTPPESVPAEVTAALLNAQKAQAEQTGRAFPPLPPPFSMPTGGNQEADAGGNNTGGQQTGSSLPSFPTGLGAKGTGSLRLPPAAP